MARCEAKKGNDSSIESEEIKNSKLSDDCKSDSYPLRAHSLPLLVSHLNILERRLESLESTNLSLAALETSRFARRQEDWLPVVSHTNVMRRR